MAYIVTTNTILQGNVVSPALPVSPEQYSKAEFDKFNNVLRLYFNQLDNFISRFSSSAAGDGSSLVFPYGAFHQDGTTTLTTGISNVSTTPIVVGSTAGFPVSGWFLIESEIVAYTGTTSTSFTGITRGVFGTTNVAHSAGVAISEVQGTGSPTTIGQVLFNNTDYSNGVYTTAADYSKLYFSTAGLYNLQLSVQLLNYTTSADNVTIWLRQKGTDVAASAGIVETGAKHGSAPGATIASWNYFLDMAANDYVQLVWTSNSGDTVVATYPSGTSPVHPLSPAVIFTAQFVSAIPA